MNEKYQIPPRKWYTLEQAIKRIKQLTGEELEIADLIHYASIEKLVLSVYFIYYPARISIGNLEIINRDIFNKQIYVTKDQNFEIEDIFSFRENPKTIFEGKFIKNTIISIDYDYSGHDFWISGFMNIHSGINNKPDEINQALKNGICLNSMNILVSPQDENGNRAMINFTLDTDEDVLLPINNLFILHNDLEDFLLNKTEKIDTNEIMEKSKAGRKTTEIKCLILSIAQATFAKNPQQSRRKIAVKILEYIEAEYSEEYHIPSERTIINYLKEAEVGREKTRNRDKVTIIDPFKQD